MASENIKIGDICTYSYDTENKSLSIVEVVKELSDAVVEVKFHQVIVDESGNGYFTYLLNSGHTMNVSRKYLHRIEIIARKQARNKQLRADLQKHIDVEQFLVKLTDEQQAEIERLKSCVMSEEQVRAIMASQMHIVFKEELKTARAEAIKEFAKKLKESEMYWDDDGWIIRCVQIKDIDNLVKEMVGTK